MAARLNPRNQESVREKIRATQLVNALENHVLNSKKMSPSAVTAALGLLKKCVPDLASVEYKGDIAHRYVIETPAPSPDANEWANQHSPMTTQ